MVKNVMKMVEKIKRTWKRLTDKLYKITHDRCFLDEWMERAVNYMLTLQTFRRILAYYKNFIRLGVHHRHYKILVKMMTILISTVCGVFVGYFISFIVSMGVVYITVGLVSSFVCVMLESNTNDITKFNSKVMMRMSVVMMIISIFVMCSCVVISKEDVEKIMPLSDAYVLIIGCVIGSMAQLTVSLNGKNEKNVRTIVTSVITGAFIALITGLLFSNFDNKIVLSICGISGAGGYKFLMSLVKALKMAISGKMEQLGGKAIDKENSEI